MCKSSRLFYFRPSKPRHHILFSSPVDNFFYVFSSAYRVFRRTRFSHEFSSPLLRVISKTQTRIGSLKNYKTPITIKQFG
jgi:hypothetical protein